MTRENSRTPPSTFRLGPEIDAAMQRLFERDGISPSEQARRALRAFLEQKGVLKPERQRAATRPHSALRRDRRPPIDRS